MMDKEKINKTLLFYFIIFLLSTNSFGQYQDIEFDHYTTNDGLSHGYVYCITQDSKGFIWIGTANGLNRFDGLSFKSYLFNPNDTNSISSNEIDDFIQDSLDNLWIITNRILNVYNRNKDNFSKKLFRVNNKIYDNLFLVSCFIDSKGFFWVGARGAIFRFKLYNNPQIYKSVIDAERYILDEDDLGELNRSTTFSFIEDKKNNIWIASFSNKLFYFDNRKNKFIPQPINHPDAKKFSNKQKFLIKDHDGDFIVAIEWNGLLLWKRNENIFNLYKPNGTNTGPNDNILFGLAEDRYGQIWIGSRNKGGVNIFNKKTGKFIYYLHDESNPYSLNTNSINCFYQDKTGTMWIGTGTSKGINKYSPNKKKFNRYYSNLKNPDGLNFNNILCFDESKSGDIWIGTDGGGLNKLNRRTGKFLHYMNDPSNPNSLSSNSIISICEDHEGTLWLGTFNGGLAKMKDNKFYAYYPDPANHNSIAYRHIWYVFEDSKKNLWVATLNCGLDLFDRINNRFYHFTKKEGDSTSICDNAILQLFEDSKHNLYITTYTGVSVINLNAYDFSKMPPDIKFQNLVHREERKNCLSSYGVYCVAEDKEGNIWFGTMTTGIDKLDMSTGKFTNYNSKDGLPGNSVNSILVDENNNLWLATDKGLAKFNTKTKKVHVFDRQDGLQNVSFHGWALKTKDGEMFFGGPDGFNSFFPNRLKFNKNLPHVVITGLRIYNKQITVGEKIDGNIILSNDISETKELVLPYNQNYITFDFIALDYTIPEKNQYAYMMEGLDKDWINCGTKRETNYTNLDPGKYTFRVKASNNDGIWNEEGTSLKIIILPPWWKTWWFKMILVLFIAFCFAYILLRIFIKLKQLANQTILNERYQLKTLINNMPDQIFIKDTKSRFIILNENTVRLMGGRNEKEFINKTDFDFYPKEMADKFFKQEQEIIKTGLSLINEESTRNIERKELYFSTTKCPIINQKGETIGLIGIVSDITAKKMAQLEIEKQSEELKNYNIVLSETNVLLEERQQQIEEQSEEIKMTNEQLIEHQKRIEEQAEELRSHSENLKDINDLLVDKQQLILKQSEQLKESNQELSLLNATKDRFFSIIAHDLRNPFNVVSGFSEILLRNFDKLSPEKIHRFHEMIHTSSISGNNLLENLLQWSRSQTGRISYEPVKLNLLAVTEETVRLLEGDAERKHITFQQCIDSHQLVFADENMLKTIFRNLISNAIKFTGNDGTITLKSSANQQSVEITVADSGVGIPEDTISKLFRVDTIVSTKGTSKESGTGLGLLLCKDFVEKHNGKIWIESTVGKGSEFKFTLPAI